MLGRRTPILVVLVGLVGLPAVGQPIQSDEALINLGASKSYKLSRGMLINALQSRLCTPGYLINDEKDTTNGHEMTCRTLDSSPTWPSWIKKVIFFLPERSESATPWARVVADDKSVQVIIGVWLIRDDQRVDKVKDAHDHFFKPSEWAQGVWKALDELGTDLEREKWHGS